MPDPTQAVLAVSSNNSNRLAPIPRHRVRFSLIFSWVAASGVWVPRTTERTVFQRGGGQDQQSQFTFAESGYSDTVIEENDIDASTAFSAGALSPDFDTLVLGLGIRLLKPPRFWAAPVAGPPAISTSVVTFGGGTIGNEEVPIVEELMSAYLSTGVVMLVPPNGTASCSAFLANTDMIPAGVAWENSMLPALGKGQPCDRYALKQPLYVPAPPANGQNTVSNNRMKIGFGAGTNRLPAGVEPRINGVARADGAILALDCALIVDYARVQVAGGSVVNGNATFQPITSADQKALEFYAQQV